MLCIQSKTDDIFFNLAAEEYLLRNRTEDYMMLWRSMPVVVVGKHQNTIAEINPVYLKEHGIKIARRLTGGGAVYHDKGNLNFTFIVNGEENKLIDFMRFVNPVVEFIHHKGAPVVIGKRNDILIDGYKISGNAEHVFKTRILHHGTLLYNSDLKAMHNALSSAPGKFIDKAIQSNRAVVTNLIGYIKDGQQIEDFTVELFRYLCNFFKSAVEYDLNDLEIMEIQKLRNEKYTSWEWVFGYSPAFEVNRAITLSGKEHTIRLKIVKGIVEVAEIINSSDAEKIKSMVKRLIACRYEYNEIKHLLENAGLDQNTISNFLIELF